MSVKAIFQTASANISRLLGRLFGANGSFEDKTGTSTVMRALNPGAHFVGTTDNTALVLATNRIPHLWINGSEPLYASGSGHVGIGFHSPEALLHIYNNDNGPAISTDLILSHQGARNGYGGTAISLRVRAMKWLRSRHRMMPPTGDRYVSIPGISQMSANE